MKKKKRLPKKREPESKVFMSDEDFTSNGFTKAEENVYRRTDERVLNFNGQSFVQQREIMFKLYPDDNPLGTNVEFYVDYRLELSGYWENKEDFLKTFNL